MRITLTQSAVALTAICRNGTYYPLPSEATEADVRAFVGFLAAGTTRTSIGYQAPLWVPGELRRFPGMPRVGTEVFLTPTGPAEYAALASGAVSRSVGVVGLDGLTLEPNGLPFTVDSATPATVTTASPIVGNGSAGSPIDFKFNVRTVESYPETLEAWESVTFSGEGGTVLLPADPADGDQVRVTFSGTGTITVDANGNQFAWESDTFSIVPNETGLFEWNGSAWILAG